MILRINGFETDIELNSLLIIEDNKLFAETCLSLFNYNPKVNNDVLLLNGSKQLQSADVEYIDIVTFDINDKKFLTKMYSLLERNIVLDCDMFQIDTLLRKLNALVTDYVDELDIPYLYDNQLKFDSYLKLINLRFDLIHKTVYEKLMHILDVLSCVFPSKVFIFPNLLSFLDERQSQEVVKYINYKKINVLFVENRHYNIPIKQYIIDSDFYEYIQ